MIGQQQQQQQQTPTNLHICSQHQAHTTSRGSVLWVVWYLKQFIFPEEKTCE